MLCCFLGNLDAFRLQTEVYVCGRQPFSRRNGERGGKSQFVLKYFTGMKLRLSFLSLL